MRIKHWMPGNVPAELRNNSERLFSLIGAGKIGSAFVLWRSRIAVGGEFAVPDRIFALLAAIIHRTNGAVGLHEEAVFPGLFEAREKDAQIQYATLGNLGGDDFAFIRAVAEVAPVQDPAVWRNDIGKHRAFVPVGRKGAVQRPGSDQAPIARRLAAVSADTSSVSVNEKRIASV